MIWLVVAAVVLSLLDLVVLLGVRSRVADWFDGFEPNCRIDVDPRIYRDPESGRRFVVVRTSTTKYHWAPTLQVTAQAFDANTYWLDDAAERSCTIANALRATSADGNGGRK